MSELRVLLERILDVLPIDGITRAELEAQVARVSDGVDEYRLAENVTSHETLPDTSAPAFSVIRPSLKSIFVAWTGVGAVSGHGYYELQVSTTASTAGLLDTRQTATTWTIFDALNASGATYHFRIRAVDAAGHEGDWSAWTSQVTDPQLHGAAGEYLQSDNYAAGLSGWHIDGDGNAEFNNVTVRGLVTASTVEASTISGGSITGTDFQTNPGINNNNVEIGTGQPGRITLYDSSGGNVFLQSDGGQVRFVTSDGGSAVFVDNLLLATRNFVIDGYSPLGHGHSGSTGGANSWLGANGQRTSFDDGSVGSHNHNAPDHTHSVSI